MSDFNFPTLANNESEVRKIVEVVRNAMLGKLNCTGEFTLSTGATSTAVPDGRVGAGSLILLMPLTASANTAWTSSLVRVIDQGSSGFTVNHDSTSTSNRRFRYGVIG